MGQKMEIAEFAAKYLGIKLKPYQIEWLKSKKGQKEIIMAPRMKGMSCDLIVIDDINDVKK